MMVQHAQSTPLPPSTHAELPIPSALDEVVMACLEKDPGNRPQNADALAEALAETLTNDAWTQEHAKQWWDQHHPAAGTGTAPEASESAGVAAVDPDSR